MIPTFTEPQTFKHPQELHYRPRNRPHKSLLFGLLILSVSPSNVFSFQKVIPPHFPVSTLRSNFHIKVKAPCLKVKRYICERNDVIRSEVNLFKAISQKPPTLPIVRKAQTTVSDIFLATITTSWNLIKKSWWCFPMFIALIPPYTTLVLGTNARMPSWWAFPTLHSHGSTTSTLNWMMIRFLSSNLSYILSGLYLLLPQHVWKRNMSNRQNASNIDFEKESTTLSSFQASSYPPLLGISIVTAGIISFTYHTYQALGSLIIAEHLCFIDHAFALTSGLFFLKTCGIPSPSTLLIGMLGLITLANFNFLEAFFGAYRYAEIHSIWHWLSAGAAVSWARDGSKKNRWMIA